VTPSAIAPTIVGPTAPVLRSAAVRVASGLLIALVGVLGLVATPAPAAFSAATGVVDETQSLVPGASADTVAPATDERRARRMRQRRRRVGAVLASQRWVQRPWRLPARVVGGVPPGRAPPRRTALL